MDQLCRKVVMVIINQPLQKSKVLPIKPLVDMFLAWADDLYLDLRLLHLKCSELLVSTCMLWPSDVSPLREWALILRGCP